MQKVGESIYYLNLDCKMSSSWDIVVGGIADSWKCTKKVFFLAISVFLSTN